MPIYINEITFNPNVFGKIMFQRRYTTLDMGYQIHSVLSQICIEKNIDRPVFKYINNGKIIFYSIDDLSEKFKDIPVISKFINQLINLDDSFFANLEIEFSPATNINNNTKSGRKDIFLKDKEKNPNITREESYKNFLMNKMKHFIEIKQTTMCKFNLQKVARKQHNLANKKFKKITIPITTFKLSCKITNKQEFIKNLLNGLGKHKGFGLGSILILGIYKNDTNN